MITFKLAKKSDTEVLALLGNITYIESHGHFIENKNDLKQYTENAFSISKTEQDLNNSNNIFYIIYKNDLPIGYAKMVLNSVHKNVISKNNCQLERIYLLKDFISQNIGQQFLSFLEEKVKELQLDSIWLTVYIKNSRAIKFYERNSFNKVGNTDFLVNGQSYKNIVFKKKK